MSPKKTVYLALLFALGLSVQLSLSHSSQSAELKRSSVVAVSQPGFSISSQQQFSWAKNHADISGELKKSTISVSTLVDKGIQNALTEKGYGFTQKSGNSVMIQYHVSLESEMDDTAIAITYGLSPGLRANSSEAKKHMRGTLVVDLIDTGLNKVVWRGAIGVFTGVESTDEGRQQRVNELVVELFNSIPTAH